VGSCGAGAKQPNGFFRVDSTNRLVEQNHVGHMAGGFDNCLKPCAGYRYSESRGGELRLSNVTRDGVAVSNQDKRRQTAPERGRRPDDRWCARCRSRDRRGVPVHVEPREQKCCLIIRAMCVGIRGAGSGRRCAGSAIRTPLFAAHDFPGGWLLALASGRNEDSEIQRFRDSRMSDSRISDSRISDE